MKTYRVTFTPDMYEPSSTIYVGEKKDVAVEKLMGFDDDERFDVKIEVWEEGGILGYYYWDEDEGILYEEKKSN